MTSNSSGPQSVLPPLDPDTPRRVRVPHLRMAKAHGERLSMLTAYDTPTAQIFDGAGIDLLLVGDSYGDNILGHETTLPTTTDELIPVVRAVSRGARRAMVVADLPFGTYEASAELAFTTSVRMVKEGGANAVKLEGGADVVPHVKLLTQAGIPVLGHLGFTPQSENVLGGKRIQGRGDGAAEKLSADAVALQDAGAAAIVLEMVPGPVASRITEILDIPTIGIGAGPACDGQVLVWLDMAGIGDWSPSFAKRYAELGQELRTAAMQYADDVRAGTFPAEEHTFDS